MSGVTFISSLKIRAGWGKTGNQEFPSGASLDRFNFGQGNAAQLNYGNPDLRWETSATTNAGIDFSLFNNRLTGSVDYFYKKTSDVLFENTLTQPAPSGRIWVNLNGYVINKGVEISLRGTVLDKKDISWSLGTNISFLQNTVDGIKGFYETGALRGQGFSNVFGQRIVSDQPLNVWYLKRFINIDKTTGFSVHDGNDKYYVGSPNPTMLLGISTDVSYKKFNAALNFNGNFGHYIFNNTGATVLNIGNLIGGRNVAKTVIGGAVKESLTNPPQPSTRYLEKASYLKLANATLGYRVGNIGRVIKNLNITLTGQNLVVFTNYSGFDPEVNTDAGANGIPSLGVEYTPYPSARTIQLGINFSL